MEIVNKVMAATYGDLNVSPLSNDWDIYKIVDTVTAILAIVAGIAAFFYLIYSGILYVTAGGNPDAAKKGQQGILNAIIGLIIVGLSYVLVHSVIKYVGSLGTT